MDRIPDAATAPFGAFAPDDTAKRILGTSEFDHPHRPWALRRKLGRVWLRRSGRVFDVVFHNLRLRLHPATNAGDMGIVLNGIHGEEDEFERVAQRVAKYENFIDIGANIGLFSLIAARYLPEGRPIVAFEPSAETAERLRTNLAFNAAERVQVLEAAVAEEPGVLRLYRSPTNIGGTSAVGKPGGTIEIEVRKVVLADALNELGISRIGMLKIDIEGFEDRALLPYLDVMPEDSWPRYILIEVCHGNFWNRDVVAELESKGYRAVYRNRRNVHFALGNEDP
jgi:FkbM family methyltransferase